MICWMSTGLVEVSGKFFMKAMAFILIIILKSNKIVVVINVVFTNLHKVKTVVSLFVVFYGSD